MESQSLAHVGYPPNNRLSKMEVDGVDGRVEIPIQEITSHENSLGMTRSTKDGSIKPLFRVMDVELSAKDVVIGLDGLLSRIHFSERVHKAIDEKLSKSLIVRLLGKSIGYRTLLNRIQSMWTPMGEMTLVNLDNGYFLVRFAMDADYEKVPSKSNYSLDSTPGFALSLLLQGLFKVIASVLGKVVRINFNTTEGNRGKFARLVIVVNLDKHLIHGIMINGHHRKIEYERFLIICFGYGKYDHSKEACGLQTPNVTMEQKDPPKRVLVDGLYGPCMQGSNRKRRPNLSRKTPRRAMERNVAVASISKSKGEQKKGMEVDAVTKVQLCDVELAGVINIIGSTSSPILEKKLDTLVVSTKEKFVFAPSSLSATKHSIVQVVEEVISQSPDIVAIMEPKVRRPTADSFIRRSVSNQFLHGYCVDSSSNQGCFITFVYANPNQSRKNLVWDRLLAIDSGSASLWILGGDFNAIYSIECTIWNHEVFGQIGCRKTMLIARIRGVENALENSHSLFLVNLEIELKRELDVVLM
ncbi:hypothetical protein GQ457_05G019250 [Hibiscus cannabinus]